MNTTESIQPPRPDDATLAAFFAGRSSLEERETVEQWLAVSPEHHETLAFARRVWTHAGGEMVVPTVESIVARFRSAMDVDEGMRVRGYSHKGRAVADQWSTRKSSGRNFLRRDGFLGKQSLRRRGARAWAAAAVAGFSLALIGFVLAQRRLALPTSFTQYTTRPGQRLRVSLPDGSALTLAPQTTVRIDARDGTTSRSVWLTGEAYFDIRASSDAAFIIHTGTIATRVLGTTFDVRRYQEDSEVRVAVSTGKVVVAASKGRRSIIMLSAGMVGCVSDSSATQSTIDAAAEVTNWAAGRLVFREVPTSLILATLSRWYGYQFRLSDSSMANKKLTVWLSTESSAAALSTIKLALDADMTFSDSVVTLRPHRDTADDQPGRLRRMKLHSPQISEVGR